jgi:hypothetical protein
MIHEYPEHLDAPDDGRYTIRVDGEQRPDGTWVGWVTFTDPASGMMRRTGRETTQPTREALVYWASGLEPLYFEGAFARAGSVAMTP